MREDCRLSVRSRCLCVLSHGSTHESLLMALLTLLFRSYVLHLRTTAIRMRQIYPEKDCRCRCTGGADSTAELVRRSAHCIAVCATSVAVEVRSPQHGLSRACQTLQTLAYHNDNSTRQHGTSIRTSRRQRHTGLRRAPPSMLLNNRRHLGSWIDATASALSSSMSGEITGSPTPKRMALSQD
ncbi:hypothetical protein K461DRAFT_14298 [Myriangium duriaei CBS 260.36]|uniref:Uncharacterized protein n=1 Tax=Myriangium duriaei CBS 260.36 TaxID=1168546 RepID=A0A9P4J926_9PEZI|nr:hypothetical protein K461DRAFT_14298 [Myriangium duriaei CBS 260.36]